MSAQLDEISSALVDIASAMEGSADSAKEDTAAIVQALLAGLASLRQEPASITVQPAAATPTPLQVNVSAPPAPVVNMPQQWRKLEVEFVHSTANGRISRCIITRLE